MADNLHLRGEPDRSKINIHEEWEVGYWTAKWGISRQQLAAAVHAAGVSSAAVARHLGKTL